jgi:hypothetical protein
MLRDVVLLAWMLAAAVPAPRAPHAASVPCREQKPESWDVEIADSREPGPRIEVMGTVRSATNARPLPGLTVYVYHSDQRGQYGLDRMGRLDPRLCGVMLTNARGEYRFRSVMPGHAEGTPHVHIEVWGPRVEHQEFILQFGRELPPEARGYAGPRLLAREPDDATAITRPFSRDARGVIHVVRDLKVNVR